MSAAATQVRVGLAMSALLSLLALLYTGSALEGSAVVGALVGFAAVRWASRRGEAR